MRKLTLLLVVGLLLGVAPMTATAKNSKTVRFATFNASLNRNAAGQLAADLSTPDNAQAADGRRDHPAHPARRAADQRVRLRPGGRGPVPGQLPGGAAERRRADRLPLPLHRAVQHRHPVAASTSTTTASIGGPDDAFGFGVLPRPVRHGRLLASTRSTRDGPHLPAVPLEGHARRAAARRPGDAGAGRLVLPRGARRLPAVVEEPLGPADPRSAARPCTSWSATRPRRCSTAPRTATAPATSTRSGSGPTTSRPASVALHLRRRGPAAAGSSPGASFVIAGDQNSDPLDGDSIPGAIQQLLDHPQVNDQVTPDSRRGESSQSALRAARTSPIERPALRHRRLRRHRARATCGPTTCCPRRGSRSKRAGSSGRPRASGSSTSPVTV